MLRRPSNSVQAVQARRLQVLALISRCPILPCYGAIAVLGICMAASLIGTPHLLYEYECQGYGIRHCVYYTSCTYVGVQGRRRFHPEQLVPDRGVCPAIQFFPVARPLFAWSPWGAR
jgi:hypothetical protein